MSLFSDLRDRYANDDRQVIVGDNVIIQASQLLASQKHVSSVVEEGDVVAIVGDYGNPNSIRQLLTAFESGAIVVPLSPLTSSQHQYFFATAGVKHVFYEDNRYELNENLVDQPLVAEFRKRRRPGLVLFSSGTTGQPKAILHDFSHFLARFKTRRPTLVTLNFLMFDHIGGINTFLHTLYNRGTVVAPSGRTVGSVLSDVSRYNVELLPTTPTFIRMMLLSGADIAKALASLKLITYGTERMDEDTLVEIGQILPQVDIRQTYGMSELGILRVKSLSRDSLRMFVGGEGVETRVDDGVLKIRSETRMIGYINADDPFDADGWYNTKDIVETFSDGSIQIVGRADDWINIGGEKVMPREIESAALRHVQVARAKAVGAPNPLTGQHIELTVELVPGSELDRSGFKKFLRAHLNSRFMPQKIVFGTVPINHRFKRM